MDRRNFIGAVAVAGSASMGMAAASEAAKEDANLVLTVQNFSCVTCAIGLEAVLQKNPAIASAKAEYRTGKVRVGYDSRKITVAGIRDIITDTGLKLAS